MATIQFDAPPGLNLVGTLYRVGEDEPINAGGDPATELTESPGTYRLTIDEDVWGYCRLVVTTVDTGDTIGVYYGYMGQTGEIIVFGELAGILLESDAGADSDQYTPYTLPDNAALQFQPSVERLFGEPLQARVRALQLRQKQQAVLVFEVRGTDGLPLDLSQFDPRVLDPHHPPTEPLNFRVEFAAREAVRGVTPVTARCEIFDPKSGLVKVLLPSQLVEKPAVLEAEFVVQRPDGNLISNGLYLWVDRAVIAGTPPVGVPPVEEVRLYLRDTDPAESRLLKDYCHQLSTLCLGAVQAVRGWNSLPPAIGSYDTTNFPDRDLLMLGLSAQVFLSAAEFYRKNRLPYQAAGLSIDDMNREQNYAAVGRQRWEQFLGQCRSWKLALNAEQLYGTLRSSYSPYWG